jgi:hypothetical protein
METDSQWKAPTRMPFYVLLSPGAGKITIRLPRRREVACRYSKTYVELCKVSYSSACIQAPW